MMLFAYHTPTLSAAGVTSKVCTLILNTSFILAKPPPSHLNANGDRTHTCLPFEVHQAQLFVIVDQADGYTIYQQINDRAHDHEIFMLFSDFTSRRQSCQLCARVWVYVWLIAYEWNGAKTLPPIRNLLQLESACEILRSALR